MGEQIILTWQINPHMCMHLIKSVGRELLIQCMYYKRVSLHCMAHACIHCGIKDIHCDLSRQIWTLPLFLLPPLHIFRNIWTPSPQIIIYGPTCMLSTRAESQKGQRLGCGYKWLGGLVSRVCKAGLVLRVCMDGPIILGVQISRDRPRRIFN